MSAWIVEMSNISTAVTLTGHCNRAVSRTLQLFEWKIHLNSMNFLLQRKAVHVSTQSCCDQLLLLLRSSAESNLCWRGAEAAATFNANIHSPALRCTVQSKCCFGLVTPPSAPYLLFLFRLAPEWRGFHRVVTTQSVFYQNCFLPREGFFTYSRVYHISVPRI